MHSEQDLKKAAEYREELHGEALARVRAVFPGADRVVDSFPPDAYFQEVWDYPGQWYTVVGTPPGAGSRKDLVGTIVRDTLTAYRAAGIACSDDAFHAMLSACPDLVCEFCLVKAEDPEAKGVFPYTGAASHRLALAYAARRLFSDEWSYDLKGATCRKLKSKALFAPIQADGWLNYRKAFCRPPHGGLYSDRDFERFNAVLFPGGEEGLDVFRWSTDWSEYFDEGHEWWGALCLSVYDKSLDRFVVIFASATD